MKVTLKLAITVLMSLAVATLSGKAPKGGKMHGQDPEKMAKEMTGRMTEELGLNETQQSSIYELHLKMLQERQPQENIKGMSDEDRENMREEMKAKHDLHAAEMKNILTDEQFTKWTEHYERIKKGEGHGGRHRGHKHPKKK